MTNKKAEIAITIKQLMELENNLFFGKEEFGYFDEVDIRPHAAKIGLDIDLVMKDIDRICSTSNHNVGCHMDCTRMNVLRQYKSDKSVTMDRDHIEGLYQILMVEYGYRSDY